MATNYRKHEPRLKAMTDADFSAVFKDVKSAEDVVRAKDKFIEDRFECD